MSLLPLSSMVKCHANKLNASTMAPYISCPTRIRINKIIINWELITKGEERGEQKKFHQENMMRLLAPNEKSIFTHPAQAG